MLSIQGILNLINDNGYKRPLIIEQWKDVYYRMSLHIDGICPTYYDMRSGILIKNQVINPNKISWCDAYDWIFQYSLFSRYPHEAEVTRNWRLSQYKPFTKAPFLQIIQVITGAIFQDSGYNITVNDKDDNDYIWGANFHKKSLAKYISDSFQQICEDPNGRFVVLPKEPYHSTTTQRIEPDIWFIPSKDIIWVTKDEIIFDVDEIRWAVNGMAYFRFQKDEAGVYQNMDGLNGGYYYAHLLNKVPSYVAGGLWNNRGYYNSWLDAALPVADQFVISKSDEQMVMKQASHPFIIETDTECPSCENSSGYLMVACNHKTSCDCVDGYYRDKCSDCRGTGQISRNPGDRIIAPAEDMQHDLIKIVNPDTSINKLHLDNNKDIYLALKEALHLNYIDEAQSGVAKDKDMETRYQFILSIATDIFGRIIPGLLGDILALRNISVNRGIVIPKPTDYVLVQPTQFNIKTSMMLLEELKEGRDSGIPSYQQAALIEDYTQKQFGGDDVLQKKTCVINAIDVLANKSAADKQIAVSNNACTTRDWQFSERLDYILRKLIRSKGQEWFLYAEIDDIETEAIAEFDKIVQKIPVTDMPIVYDENRAY